MYNGLRVYVMMGTMAMSKYRSLLMLYPLLMACAVSGAQVTIVDGNGMTLEDLVREETLVTIVLKDPPARDMNNRVMAIFESTINFMTLDKEAITYNLSQIQELRVQDNRIVPRRSRLTESTLSDDESIIVRRATERALKIFTNSKNQVIRMSAALVIAVSDHERKESALGYLQALAAGNDVPTAMDATTFLYLAGIPAGEDVLRDGFQSGNRHARATAALLTGLTNNQMFLPEVQTMLEDTTVQLFPAAAKAIGRMNERSGLPELYVKMRALTDAKADAAVFALSRMGGDDVHEKMLEMLDNSEGLEWFRVLRVLYALGDEHAKKLMLEEALKQPAYHRTAGLLLAADGVWEATQFLRAYLEKAEDSNLVNLIYKARVASTLFLGGDFQHKILLQELVNIQPDQIYARGRTSDEEYKKQTAVKVQISVINHIAYTGSPDLLSLLVGPIEGTGPLVAITACTAALAIGNPEFGSRLRETRL